MTNNKKSSGIHVGSASILLIFVLLCLVSFATLSIVSANADNKLTAKVLERTTAYYNACNEAERNLADIDQTLATVYSSCDSSEEYFQTVGHTKSYTLPISESQTLQITIEILYPETDEDTFYRITSWQVVNAGN